MREIEQDPKNAIPSTTGWDVRGIQAHKFSAHLSMSTMWIISYLF